MANVRLDANGLPKGPVYEAQFPLVHRQGVTAVDTADPAGPQAGVDCTGFRFCRFDLDLSGTDIRSLEVQVLFWNPRRSAWFAGARRALTGPGRYALEVEARGAVVFLKVTGFEGTSFTLDADAVLS